MSDKKKTKDQLIDELAGMRQRLTALEALETERMRAEEKFRRILDAAPDAMVIVNTDGKIVLVNAQTEQLFGYTRGELIGQSVEMLIPERFQAPHGDHRRAYASQPRVRPMGTALDLYARRKDGSEFPVEISLSPIETDDGVLVSSAIRDVTERRQAERALRQKTAFVQLLQRVAVAANEASTSEKVLQYALDQVCAHTGWPVGDVYLLAEDTRAELVPTGIWHLEDPTRFATFRQVTDVTRFVPGVGLPGRVLASGKPAWIIDVTKDPNFPRAKLAKDIGVKAGFAFPVLVGTEVLAVLEFFSAEAIEPNEPLLDMMAQVGTQLGRVIERTRAEAALQRAKDDLEFRVQERTAELTVANEDLKREMEARTRAKEALRQAEAKYRSIFENAVEGIFQTTSEGRYLSANSSLARIYGYESPEELIQNLSDIGSQLYVEPARRAEFTRLMQEQRAVSEFESQVYRKDGSVIWVSENSRAVRDASGRLLYYEGTVEDISARKEAEEALRAANAEVQETREYLERLIESATDAIISTDKAGNVVLFNEGAEAMLGFRREEIIGQRVSLVYESVDRAKELMRQMRKQGGTVSAFETTLRAKDGTPIPVMISTSILYDEQGQEAGTVGFNKDLRPLKQAEEELRRAKAQIQALRIEIDQTKMARRVSEITETDYFQDLEKKVEELRDRPKTG